jgi:2,5-diketo-D-gluconate reductase A
MTVPTVTLNNSVTIPQLGFGVYQIPPESVENATALALKSGYRHIDTAAAYANEAGVGRAIRDSGIPRDELFVTTKLRNADQGYESTLEAFESSRTTLGLDVIDLYLIHWPYPRHELYVETWKAMESLYEQGRVRAIGVSNFLEPHLDEIMAEGSVVPAVNQIEIHPSFQQRGLAVWSSRHGIAVEAYIQSGYIAIPKSTTTRRIVENVDIFDFTLDGAEMSSIDSLEAGFRTSGDPAVFDYPQK